jgi:hypothetical protein
MASLSVGLACVRLMTVAPETVAIRNENAWRIRKQPGAAPPVTAPAVADAPPASEGGFASADAGLVPATPAAPAETAAAAPSVAEGSTPAATPPAPDIVIPLPFRDRPEIQEAMRSPADSLRVPTGLYALDPLLTAHRREMDSQASARHAVGAGSIVFGVISGGIAAWAISVGNANVNSSNSQTSDAASRALVYGWILAVLSAGEIIAGVATAASGSDPTPLQSYYRETYAAPR